MYLAEIHGKLSRDNENKEDILTSNVFSFFKYTDRTVFLYTFLKSLELDISPEDAINAEFNFWPSYEDRTQPDLVIIVGKYYLLIEAKYFSGFGEETELTKHQLVREIEGGLYEAKSLGKTFQIISVTAHYFKPFDIDKDIPPEFHPHFQWINWQSITFFINQTLETHSILPAGMRLLADDLYSLLQKKNLRQFEGVKALQDYQMLRNPSEQVFFEASTASYRGDFIGFLNAFELDKQFLRYHPDIFFAASTADYRGDFIGFDNALSQYKQRFSPHHQIFYNTDIYRARFFHSLRNLRLQPVSLNGHIFFIGGSNE